MLSFAVDIAQIVSAIATVAAVIVALRLATRAEAQRLQFFPAIFGDTITGDNPQDSYLEHSISVTIVNAGMLPAVIQSTAFIFSAPDRREWDWHFGPVYGAGEFPMKLEHGQQVRAAVTFNVAEGPWDQVPLNQITSRRMKFLIETSLGRTYVHRPNKAMLTAMKHIIQNARNTQSIRD